jgi:hypothetical protein
VRLAAFEVVEHDGERLGPAADVDVAATLGFGANCVGGVGGVRAARESASRCGAASSPNNKDRTADHNRPAKSRFGRKVTLLSGENWSAQRAQSALPVGSHRSLHRGPQTLQERLLSSASRGACRRASSSRRSLPRGPGGHRASGTPLMYAACVPDCAGDRDDVVGCCAAATAYNACSLVGVAEDMLS